MTVPFLDLTGRWESVRSSIHRDIEEIARDNSFVYGEPIQRLEKSLAELHGVEHVVTCSSGTDALYLLLRAHDIGPGDKVIIPANTFIATAFAVSMCGAEPVPCDVDFDTGLVSIDHIKMALGQWPDAKAIIVVHLFGQSVDMAPLQALCLDRDILLLEDGAQCAGNQAAPMGLLTDGATTSFYPGKNLGCWGQGGAVFTQSEYIAQKVQQIASQGQAAKYKHVVKGGNHRLDNIQAVVLNHGLTLLEKQNNNRRAMAELYDALLSKTVIQPIKVNTYSVYHLYVVVLPEELERNKFMKGLNDRGIGCGIHYPELWIHSDAYDNCHDYSLPNAEELAKRIVSLPIFGTMTNDQVIEVFKAIKEVAMDSQIFI